MKHKGMWVLIIAVGVFLGIFLHDRITEYRERLAVQEMLGQMQMEADRAQMKADQVRKKHLVEKEKIKANELYRNTACAINVDTDVCLCIHEKTGAKISLSQNECKKRAKQITW